MINKRWKSKSVKWNQKHGSKNVKQFSLILKIPIECKLQSILMKLNNGEESIKHLKNNQGIIFPI